MNTLHAPDCLSPMEAEVPDRPWPGWDKWLRNYFGECPGKVGWDRTCIATVAGFAPSPLLPRPGKLNIPPNLLCFSAALKGKFIKGRTVRGRS